MPAPALGEVAARAGVVDAGKLDLLLRSQRAQRTQGQFSPLGELMTELRVARPKVRALLREAGSDLVACELCGTRYLALGGRSSRACLRCGRPLLALRDDGPLSSEDVLSEPGPQGDALLREHLARRPRHGAFLILGEALGGMQVLGIVLVVGAILLVQIGDFRGKQSPTG